MLNWWYAQTFGLWLTPMLIAIVLHIPRITNNAAVQPRLAHLLLGDGLLYTGVGDHHIPVPDAFMVEDDRGGVLVALLIPVFAFTINILGTMKATGTSSSRTYRCVHAHGLLLLLLVNIRERSSDPAVQQAPALHELRVAHAHLALLGAFTILGMGVIDYIAAQVYARPLFSRTLTEWQYWLVTIGFTGFFSVLMSRLPAGFSWAAGIRRSTFCRSCAYYIARGIFER
jgi:cytochrome c oxidase cbb3-type subunit 1